MFLKRNRLIILLIFLYHYHRCIVIANTDMINDNQKCNGDIIKRDIEGNYFSTQYDILSNTLYKNYIFGATFIV